ncbi:MAG: peptidoglycan recognition family protein [Limnobacter sp.]|nr:peptidoglycan recognition family protein [Limnobacter sp.]
MAAAIPLRIIEGRDAIRKNILLALGIVPRARWGLLTPKHQNLEYDWNYHSIAIHHSGNKGYKNPKQIEDYHMRNNQFDDVGYHFMVSPEGNIFEGRNLLHKGSHVKASNTGRIGILVMGDFDEQWWDEDDELTPKQLNSTKKLIKTLKQHFNIRELGGHREFLPGSGYTCPGNVLMNIIEQLRTEYGILAPQTAQGSSSNLTAHFTGRGTLS